MKKDVRIISYMAFTLVLVLGLTISASFLLADAWEQPTGDTPSGGFVRPVENEGDNIVSLSTRPLTINDNFAVGADGLYVDAGAGRVGIGMNTAPTVALDINGPVRLGLFSNLGRNPAASYTPFCTTNILGAIGFNYSNLRAFVCTNTGWERLHYDIDGTGKWN